MDENRQRIQEDLRGQLAGDVRCDDVFLQLYASDASIFQIRPVGVVRPRTRADVQACVRYADEHRLSLHARGAGTGLAGQSLGPGLVLDFSCHFRRVSRIDTDSVRVQPGVVLERLNHLLRPLGRQFGPDPAMASVTTLGSVAAIDAAGSHWLRWGSARRHLRSLEVVLADGNSLELGREPLSGGVSHDPHPRKRELLNAVADVLSRHAALIEKYRPKTRVNCSGYYLWDVLSDESLNMPALLAGSEGTLALFTELTLDTQPLPKYRGIALLFFDRLESAARAVAEIMTLDPATCDIVDRRHLNLARETDSHFEGLIPPTAEALLLVEQSGDDPVAVREGLRQVVDRVRRRRRLAFDSRLAFSEEEVELFWQLARRVVPTLYRLKGSSRPLPFIEDVAVPPETLGRFLVEMQNVLKRHEVTASLFGHAGHGQLHIRPFLNVADPRHVRIMEPLAAELYDAVLRVGGTISGEHGDGLSRTPFLERQYGELVGVFREIKRIFDPHNLLNPNKIVCDPPDPLVRNLRPVDAVVVAVGDEKPADGADDTQPPATIELQLNWTPAEVAHLARSCNGCGACRAQSADVRMCPIFRFAPAEEASPRAKANLMRAVLTGQLDPQAIKQDDFKEVADLCVNCKMCRIECPASVDIPKLMLEAKAAYVADNGLRAGDWILTRLDLICSLASLASPLTNWLLANRPMRWLVDKLLGIAQGRKMPRFASRTFVSWAHHHRLTRPTRRAGRKVLYFVDTYANYNDPLLAIALVRLLEHNGAAVYVHPGLKQSGMSMVSVGALDHARRIAVHNLPILAEAVRQGYTILASEPSAALCLSHEYPLLIDDDDARLVAEHTNEACTWLWNLHLTGELKLDFRPLHAAVAYHMPCHLRALGEGTPGENLMRLIPGLNVERMERGCSGMAGTFGMKRRNYRASLRSGWGLISAIRESRCQAGTTECTACKIQMEQGTTKPTIHPLKLLALSYGLLPEGANLLAARGQDLTVT